MQVMAAVKIGDTRGYELRVRQLIQALEVHPTPTPYTLHPTPYTLHPAPYTLHPTPYTLEIILPSNPTP